MRVELRTCFITRHVKQTPRQNQWFVYHWSTRAPNLKLDTHTTAYLYTMFIVLVKSKVVSQGWKFNGFGERCGPICMRSLVHHVILNLIIYFTYYLPSVVSFCRAPAFSTIHNILFPNLFICSPYGEKWPKYCWHLKYLVFVYVYDVIIRWTSPLKNFFPPASHIGYYLLSDQPQ